MSKLYLMLADAEISEIFDAQKSFADNRLKELLITFGALALAVVVAVIWAILYSQKKKKKKHPKHRHHRDRKETAASSASVAVKAPVENESRSRKRRRRRPHRPLNPTLAQTGGLPPLRDKNAPLPPMP